MSLSGLDCYAASLREKGRWSDFEQLRLEFSVYDAISAMWEDMQKVDRRDENKDMGMLREVFGDKLSC